MVRNEVEQRRSRRMGLQSIGPAFFGDVRVKIVDISMTGVGISHHTRLAPGEMGLLEFTFEGDRVALPCSVVHSSPLPGGSFRSGLGIRADANVRLSEFLRRLARWESDRDV